MRTDVELAPGALAPVPEGMIWEDAVPTMAVGPAMVVFWENADEEDNEEEELLLELLEVDEIEEEEEDGAKVEVTDATT